MEVMTLLAKLLGSFEIGERPPGGFMTMARLGTVVWACPGRARGPHPGADALSPPGRAAARRSQPLPPILPPQRWRRRWAAARASANARART
jgi:hypothetical protein